MAVEVHGEKVAGCHIIVMTEPRVDLERARASIVPVIQLCAPPGDQHISDDPQRKHGEHAHSYQQHPMDVKARSLGWLYRCGTWCWLALRQRITVSCGSAAAWRNIRRQVVYIDYPLARVLRH